MVFNFAIIMHQRICRMSLRLSVFVPESELIIVDHRNSKTFGSQMNRFLTAFMRMFIAIDILEGI